MIKKVIALFVVLAAVSTNSLAQGPDTAWVRAYNGPGNGDDGPSAMVVDNSGNIYVAGVSADVGGDSVFTTIKYNADGDTVWIRHYNRPGTEPDRAVDIAVDASGFVYVLGVTWSSGTKEDFVTIKYTPDGHLTLVKTYDGPGHGEDHPRGIVVDSSGNVYVFGDSDSGGEDDDFCTIKYIPSGIMGWERRFAGPMQVEEIAEAIALDPAGNIYVTGSSSRPGTEYDFCTIKYRPNGDTAWVRWYNGPQDSMDLARDMVIDGSANIYVTGLTSEVEQYYDSYDIATVKYDSSGNEIWASVYDGQLSANDQPTAIAVDNPGNVYVTGFCDDDQNWPYHSPDYVTLKYFPTGDTAWVRKYNGPGDGWDAAVDIAVDISGNVFVTGNLYDVGYNRNFATIGYDAPGTQRWVKLYDGPAGGDDNVTAIALDSDGDIYVTGRSPQETAYPYNYDFVTIKYYFCCLNRGDADGSGDISVADVTYLVDYLFRGGNLPPCTEEANVDAVRSVNVADVTYLVDYLFRSGPQPPPCP
jgi:uncharacterized delta-60 repeat protein